MFNVMISKKLITVTTVTNETYVQHVLTEAQTY